MNDDFAGNIIIDITINPDGVSASDGKGNRYEIESMILGAGGHRKAIKYENGALLPDGEHRAEILPNGKLNIL